MKLVGKKVFVGVSGGVDSSVALALLQKGGYDVTGVFLKVWSPDFLPCNWKEERQSAMRVCATLKVPFLTIDCEEEYKREVADYMVKEYKAGRTPNPDVFCNKFIKFGLFLKKAIEIGADFIATGHYAKNSHLSPFCELSESKDKEKDQSYFLYTLNQNQLSKIIFPVGEMTKPEVRALAQKLNLPTANKKDSQGICFIGDVNMKDFLSHYIKPEIGDVLNTEGKIIGKHNGAIFYTIGERHGFQIMDKTPDDSACFVVSKDVVKNTITVAKKEEQSARENAKEVIIKNMHWISGLEENLPLKTSVRIRYRQQKQDCVIKKIKNNYHIIFENAQKGVALGQSAVFYEKEICLGGGIIEEILS